MTEIIETRRLNKFIKEQLLKILSTPGIEVRFIGDNFTIQSLFSEYYTGYAPVEKANPHVFIVNKSGKKVFEYKYSKNNVSVYVEDTCVANVAAPALGDPDIQELKDALVEKIIQAKKEKAIATDRNHMMYYDIRALEYLKQFSNNR